jgi:hypothetical protein
VPLLPFKRALRERGALADQASSSAAALRLMALAPKIPGINARHRERRHSSVPDSSSASALATMPKQTASLSPGPYPPSPVCRRLAPPFSPTTAKRHFLGVRTLIKTNGLRNTHELFSSGIYSKKTPSSGFVGGIYNHWVARFFRLGSSERFAVLTTQKALCLASDAINIL